MKQNYQINFAYQSPVPLTGILDIDQTNVLEDTLRFFSEDVGRRAFVADNTCRYRTSDGRACAIGRLMPDAIMSRLKSEGTVACEGIFYYLPIEVKFLGVRFLTDLQRFHDHPNFWSPEGLTVEGKRFYNRIKLGIQYKTYLAYIFEDKEKKNENPS